MARFWRVFALRGRRVLPLSSLGGRRGRPRTSRSRLARSHRHERNVLRSEPAIRRVRSAHRAAIFLASRSRIEQIGRCGIDSRMGPFFEARYRAVDVCGLTSRIPHEVVRGMSRYGEHLPIATSLSRMSVRSDFKRIAERAAGFHGRMVVPQASEGGEHWVNAGRTAGSSAGQRRAFAATWRSRAGGRCADEMGSRYGAER